MSAVQSPLHARLEFRLLLLAVVVLFVGVSNVDGAEAVRPTVEVEEEVYSYEPANNGAGPMWCFGDTCIVRADDEVFVSGLHRLESVQPLNNCVPSLFVRKGNAWEQVFHPSGRTREPSPLAMFDDGRVFLSVNPTTAPVDAYSGPSHPGILEFQVGSPQVAPRRLAPKWQGEPPFTEHSYRSFAADGERHELILFQNIDYTHAEWSFCDAAGEWSACGQLHWPRDETADDRPIRVCYAAVALKDRRVYFFGVSDIVEPNPEWLAHKRELTGREWDYVFRRLYFTWSDDIRTGEFRDWVEVSNVDATSGSAFPNDLLVQPNGEVLLLWNETALDERLREHFFPNAQQRRALEYAVIRDGEIVHRSSLVQHVEGVDGVVPGRGRLHQTPDGQPWVVYYVNGVDQQGNAVAENQLLQVGPHGAFGSPIGIDLDVPLSSFFTNTARAGCSPSQTLDLFGPSGATMRYARIRLP